MAASRCRVPGVSRAYGTEQDVVTHVCRSRRERVELGRRPDSVESRTSQCPDRIEPARAGRDAADMELLRQALILQLCRRELDVVIYMVRYRRSISLMPHEPARATITAGPVSPPAAQDIPTAWTADGRIGDILIEPSHMCSTSDSIRASSVIEPCTTGH